MRTFLVGIVLLGVTGCAASKPSAPAWSGYGICVPCPQPCTPDTSCGPAVAKAPAQPAPAPAPAAPAAAKEAFFAPGPGPYFDAQSVKLWSPTPGAVIHYTTDGSTPTASSPVYTEPVPVDKTTTIQAIAMAPGYADSPVSSATYTISPPPAPPEPARVVVEKERLQLKEKVLFDTGKSTIKPESYALLDDVATALKGHPDVKKVVIEGHTDSKGNKAMNTKLSQQRAEAVRTYLVNKGGVEADRLDAKGFGPTRPIADNKTAKGREENRRVEFVIPQM